jgi:hypothetical protein
MAKSPAKTDQPFLDFIQGQRQAAANQPTPPIPAQGQLVGSSGLTHSDNVPAGGDGVTKPQTVALP